MSGLTLQSVGAAENEFFAEETLVVISPNFDHDKFYLTSGCYGPFESGDTCVVPLWLAINLRKRNKCTIVTPEWMAIASLERNVEQEKNEVNFEPLPFHYIEISQLLLVHARDDIISPDTVAALLQDIQSIRIDRAKAGMLAIAESFRKGLQVSTATLNNISAIEILTIKRFIVESIGYFLKLIKIDNPAENRSGDSNMYGDEGSQSQAPVAVSRPLRRFRDV